MSKGYKCLSLFDLNQKQKVKKKVKRKRVLGQKWRSKKRSQFYICCYSYLIFPSLFSVYDIITPVVWLLNDVLDFWCPLSPSRVNKAI